MLSWCNWQIHLMGAHHVPYILNNRESTEYVQKHCLTQTERLMIFDLNFVIVSSIEQSLRSQTVANTCALCETQRFVLVCKRACHWPLAWAGEFQFTPEHQISLTSLSVLLSLLFICLWSGLIPLVFKTGMLCASHNVSHVCNMLHPFHSQWCVVLIRADCRLWRCLMKAQNYHIHISHGAVYR